MPLIGGVGTGLVMLRRRRVLVRYLILAGAVRFAIEFIRINLPIVGPFTLAQLIALCLVGAGIVLSLRSRVSA